MNRDIKRFIYIGGAVLIILFVLALILKLLPWLILGGIVGYIIIKIVGFFKEKSKKEELDESKYSEENDYSSKAPTDEYTTGEVIDVEYEEVNDKEK